MKIEQISDWVVLGFVDRQGRTQSKTISPKSIEWHAGGWVLNAACAYDGEPFVIPMTAVRTWSLCKGDFSK